MSKKSVFYAALNMFGRIILTTILLYPVMKGFNYVGESMTANALGQFMVSWALLVMFWFLVWNRHRRAGQHFGVVLVERLENDLAGRCDVRRDLGRQPYRCPHCDGWHLGHPKEMKKKVA